MVINEIFYSIWKEAQYCFFFVFCFFFWGGGGLVYYLGPTINLENNVDN